MDFRIDSQIFSTTHEDDQMLIHPIPAATATIYESEIARIIKQTIDTGTWRIVINTLTFEDCFTLKAVAPKDAAGCLYFVLSGEGMSVAGAEEGLVPTPGFHNLCILGPDEQWDVEFEEGVYQTLQVILPTHLVEQFKSRSDALKRDVESLQRLKPGPVVRQPFKTTPYSQRLITDIQTCKLTGRRAAAYLGAICRELLLTFIYQLKYSQQGPFDTLLDGLEEGAERPAPGLEEFRLPAATLRILTDDHYNGLLQSVCLPDLTLGINHFLVNRDAGQRFYTKGPVFSLHCMYRAGSKASLASEEAPALGQGEYYLFYLKDELSRRWLRRGEYVFVDIEITPALLTEYCRYYPAAFDIIFILPYFMSKHGAPARPLKYNKVVEGLLDKILHCPYTGKMATIYLQPLCLQLLRHFLQQYLLEKLPETYRLTLNDDRKAALEVCLDQVDDFVSGDQDIKRVAKKYNLRENTLDKLFWENYQVSIAGFIYRYRMDEAFRLISTSPFPDKTTLVRIARQCGYGGIKELQRAFADYYDCEIAELFQ